MGGALTVAWVLALMAQLGVDILCSKMLPQLYNSQYYYWLMYIVCVYMIQVPAFVLLCGGRGSLSPVQNKKKITVSDFFRLIVVCVSLTYIFNFVGAYVNDYIARWVGHPIINPLTTLDNTNQVLMFACSGIISPFMEEVMFRGVMLKKVRPYGDKAAVWFTAITFGLFHGNFSQFFYAVVLGLVFGAIAVKTNRLVYTILLHIAINITGAFVVPAVVSSERPFVAEIGAYAVLAAIVIGAMLGMRMLPHLKVKEKLGNFHVERMFFNPGFICFLLMSGFMFYLTILGI